MPPCAAIGTILIRVEAKNHYSNIALDIGSDSRCGKNACRITEGPIDKLAWVMMRFRGS
jgi:hypothetical protein